MTEWEPPAEAGLGVAPDVEHRVREVLTRCALARDGGAYAAVFGAEAIEAARPGHRASGPLETVTVAVKDMIAVRGHANRAGSRTREDAPTEQDDAPVVAVLRSAGAVLVGLTAMHELAFGVTGINPYAGTPANPADVGRVPGGSSSGSAVAVATGGADAALGTDTGGSVRIPAALCGVVGYKPAYGRFPIGGVLALAPSLDHVGVLGSSVAVVAAVDRLFGPAAQHSTGARTRRFGVDWSRLEDAEPVVADAVGGALERIARIHGLVDVRLPPADEVVEVTNTVLLFEAARTYGSEARDPESGLGDDVRARLESGLRVAPADYERAKERARALTAAVRATLARLDGVVEPTVPIVAPLLADGPTAGPRLVADTRLANLTGLPAISLPVPVDGLPVGLQLTGTDSGAVLVCAAALEEMLGPPTPPVGQRTS